MLVWIDFGCSPSSMELPKRKGYPKMKRNLGTSTNRRIGRSSGYGLDSKLVTSIGIWVKALALGFTATLLFSVGLYIGISGLVVVFLELIL